MDIQASYTWTGTYKNGVEFTTGGDLENAAKIAFYPAAGGLPEHILSGVSMKRRFARGFVRGFGGGMKDYVHCVVGDGFRFWLFSSTGRVLITPEDFELYI
jgi:hypothetical protein